ncbi:MAG: hypothetical protein PHO03_06125 [Candidatus Omnitrophica bacterium]|nr:hypothetical protein [Candidatus Omnitrophota bacterium]
MYNIIQDSLALKLKNIFSLTNVVYTASDKIRRTQANKKGSEVADFFPYLVFWRTDSSVVASRPGAPLNMALVRSGIDVEMTNGTMMNIKLIACDFAYTVRIYAKREDLLDDYERIFYITKFTRPMMNISFLNEALKLPLVLADEIHKDVEEGGEDMTKESVYYFETNLTVQGFLVVSSAELKRIETIIKSIYSFDGKVLIEREIIS